MKKAIIVKNLAPAQIDEILLACLPPGSVRKAEVKLNLSRGTVFKVTKLHATRMKELRQIRAAKALAADANADGRIDGTGTMAVTLALDPQPSPGSPALTRHQERRLQLYESFIHRGFRAVYQAGRALKRIRDLRLYSPKFSSFENYCKARWGITKTSVNRQIAAAVAVQDLKDESAKGLSEWQLRPLTLVPQEQRLAVWEEVKKQARSSNIPISAKAIRTVACRAIAPRPAGRVKTKTASKSRSKDFNDVMRALDAAEAGVKAGNMEAVAAALSRIRGALGRLKAPQVPQSAR